MTDPTDSELAAFEAELAQLRPAPLSAQLQSRVASGCVAGPAAESYRWGWLRPAFAMVAVVAIAATITIALARRWRADRPAAVAELKPVSAQSVLLSARDEGEVLLGDGTPARQVRASYLETRQWKDPRSHASVVWTSPNEEVQIVPVSFQ